MSTLRRRNKGSWAKRCSRNLNFLLVLLVSPMSSKMPRTEPYVPNTWLMACFSSSSGWSNVVKRWVKWLPWSHFRHLSRAREKSSVGATRSGVAHILYASGCTVSFVRSATVMTSRRRGQNAKSHRRAFSKAIFLLSRFSVRVDFAIRGREVRIASLSELENSSTARCMANGAKNLMN